MLVTFFSYVVILSSLLLVAQACGSDDNASSPATTVVGPSSAGTKWSYTCAGGKSFEALYYPADQGKAVVTVDGMTVEMTHQPSGSGTSYAGGGYTLRTKGTDAFVEQGDQTVLNDCTGKQV
jgi:membrane-bound inhibitor of C-type lysozyme